MAVFDKHNDLHGVQIITGPRSVLLRLLLFDERVEDVEVVAYLAEGLYRDPRADVARARVLEGTDEANRQYGTSYHPWLARYAVEDFSDECPMLRRAAFAVVERLAVFGEEGYVGPS